MAPRTRWIGLFAALFLVAGIGVWRLRGTKTIPSEIPPPRATPPTPSGMSRPVRGQGPAAAEATAVPGEFSLDNLMKEWLGLSPAKRRVISLVMEADAAFEHSNWTIAEAKYLEAAALLRAEKDPDPTALALVTNNLAFTRMWMGKYADSRKGFLEALELNRSRFGELDDTVARNYNNLGLVNHWDGRAESDPERKEALFRESERWQLAALELRERLYGKFCEDVEWSQNNLGRLYMTWGNYPKAVELFRKSVEYEEHVHGRSDPEILDVLDDLHGALLKAGRKKEASEIMERIKEIQSQSK
jgi:tetratricopeptide (TPR) repeat protein